MHDGVRRVVVGALRTGRPGAGAAPAPPARARGLGAVLAVLAFGCGFGGELGRVLAVGITGCTGGLGGLVVVLAGVIGRTGTAPAPAAATAPTAAAGAGGLLDGGLADIVGLSSLVLGRLRDGDVSVAGRRFERLGRWRAGSGLRATARPARCLGLGRRDEQH